MMPSTSISCCGRHSPLISCLARIGTRTGRHDGFADNKANAKDALIIVSANTLPCIAINPGKLALLSIAMAQTMTWPGEPGLRFASSAPSRLRRLVVYPYFPYAIFPNGLRTRTPVASKSR